MVPFRAQNTSARLCGIPNESPTLPRSKRALGRPRSSMLIFTTQARGTIKPVKKAGNWRNKEKGESPAARGKRNKCPHGQKFISILAHGFYNPAVGIVEPAINVKNGYMEDVSACGAQKMNVVFKYRLSSPRTEFRIWEVLSRVLKVARVKRKKRRDNFGDCLKGKERQRPKDVSQSVIQLSKPYGSTLLYW